MPVQTSYPGVYVQEVPSGVRTIMGVSTSVALFIGRAAQGPMDEPILCLNYTDFERSFSSSTLLSDLPRQVKLFFINGGTQCYVMRIAQGATAARVELRNEAQTNVLALTAKQAGQVGETLRAIVTYRGEQPETNFNLELFRWELNSAGQRVRANDGENWPNLSMDPQSPNFAPTFLTQNSHLVNAALVGVQTPINGYSQSGLPLAYVDAADQIASWNAALGNRRFRINVDGNGWVVVGPFANNHADPAALTAAIEQAIETAYDNINISGVTTSVTLEAGPAPAGPDTASDLLRIESANQGAVLVAPADANDAAVPLQLGSSQGGIEVGPYASYRPAPSGITLRADQPAALNAVAEDAAVAGVTFITLDELDAAGNPVAVNVPFTFQASDSLVQRLDHIRDAVNDYQALNPQTFFWRADRAGYRLSIVPTRGADNFALAAVATGATDIGGTANFTNNTRYYSIGSQGAGGFQVAAGVAATDGTAPLPSDYDRAYRLADDRIDLFNLLILPADRNPAVPHTDLWSMASVFCRNRRAFLLIDAPETWTNVQQAAAGINALRIGMVRDHSAVFYPRLRMREDRLLVDVGASGAIAGLMARTDASRGVWKAPAGTEADLRGITGVNLQFSDGQNGVLNPRGINTIRVFPNGIVNWGARTLDGDDDFASEWKYIPVRRTALFIEESLYRGLKWVVFEPNDEPLWAQIRLNVGAFMHNLFRQGAFQGQKRSDAYFVKCDRETTTQNDINLGIVNVWVGFAPLKPAEFVILYLQQMTGQIQV